MFSVWSISTSHNVTQLLHISVLMVQPINSNAVSAIYKNNVNRRSGLFINYFKKYEFFNKKSALTLTKIYKKICKLHPKRLHHRCRIKIRPPLVR